MSVLDIILVAIMSVLLIAMIVSVVWLCLLSIGYYDDEPGHEEKNKK